MLKLKRSIHKTLKKYVWKIAIRWGVPVLENDHREIIEGLKKYGFFESKSQQKSIDQDGNPIPWFNYSAIEYLKQLDLSDRQIFEWGSGNSSLFFSDRCKSIISVEADKDWYELVKRNVRPNQQLIYCQTSDIAKSIDSYGKFDIIIIDSYMRYECGLRAIHHLKPGGLIILDNSDWYHETSKILRESANLIEVDMHGFGPINTYTTTTSFYFSRDFNFKPIAGRQPLYSRCAIVQTGKDDKIIN